MREPIAVVASEGVGLPLVTRDDWWRHEKELQELRKEMDLRDKMREDFENRIERMRSKYWRWIGILIAICGVQLGVIVTLLVR